MFKGIYEPIAPLRLGWEEAGKQSTTVAPTDPDIQVVDLYFDPAPHAQSIRPKRRSDDTEYSLPPGYDFLSATFAVQPQLRDKYPVPPSKPVYRATFCFIMGEPGKTGGGYQVSWYITTA